MINALKKTIVLTLELIILFAVATTFDFDLKTSGANDYGVINEHVFEEMPELTLPDDVYLSYSDFRNNIAPTSAAILSINMETWDKIIRFETADELYRFSMDVSYKLKYTPFETKLTDPAISRLLSLDYVLGRDIDYSVMKSKRFSPIGYDFMKEDTHYQQIFTGTFDGNGFEISNLYVSGFDDLTEILYEGTELETEISYTEYYAMFAYNEGTIKNFGLINPTYEFNFESDTLYKAANIVGKNLEDGVVHHVYAIDYRATALVSGIRMVASSGEAAGILFDNYGDFHDAYFASRVVVNASYGSRFTVHPVLYQNHSGGTYSDLAFDDTLYQESVTVSGSTYSINEPNDYATSMTTTELRSSNAVLGDDWSYYPAESNPYAKYPTTFGLSLITTPIDILLSDEVGDKITLNQYYVIEDALDFIAFSKMLNYTNVAGQTPYREMNYVITGNIDMRSVSANSYQTPTVEFSGILAGIDNETYIYGLDIQNGIAEESYYAGMFGILSGSIYNLIFHEAKVTLTETESYAGVQTYVGLIAGLMNGGMIRNVLVDVTIDLGNKTIGELHVGSILGKASGTIRSVYAEGSILGNTNHIYRTDILINPTYHMGGILGSVSSAKLVMLDAVSHVDIEGIGTTSTSLNASTNPTFYMGGIIGYSHVTSGQEHVYGMFSSYGNLSVEEMISQYSETYYLGGIIGQSAGGSYVLSQSFGKFYNHTTMDPKNRGTNFVIAGGILTSNHSETVEFIHVFNQSDALFDYFIEEGGTITGNLINISYTTLINNVGGPMILSQATNEQSLDLYGDVDFSGLYTSSLNSYTLIRFVENKGDIIYKNQTVGQTNRIAGISLSTNIDYLNVTYSGNIHIYNLVMQTNTTTEKQFYVAGFTHTLSMNRIIKNGLVSGEIIVGGITTNTVNRTPQNNLFVGGFVNLNESGDMDPNGTLDMPVATMGIINSINNATLTSTYSSAYRGIVGHGNIFVGGLATFNDGDIQDSANLGDVRFENTSNVDTNNVTFNTASTAGGATTKFRYGVITGGIAAAVISSKSRIYDSANNGMIIALSKNFTRAGGILGMAIHNELINGNVTTGYTTSSSDIQNSILSNCINYGVVSALTISISDYSSSRTLQTMSSGTTNNFRYDITMPVEAYSYNNYYYSSLSSSSVRLYTRTSTEERPGINAAAGGVIGYGLSIMRRMVNHGQISSTDVAGGVVGATVVFVTAYVKIDTAINYGTVRAFNRGTSQNNWLYFNAVDIMDYESIRDHFYPVDSTFIFPETYSDIRLYPEDKRGFGGIFGRLQRAANQFMYGNNDSRSTFNFIVNMDPNVDLIGRLDQVYNFYSSLRYFDFTNAVYYSAKKHDTTQAVFTGISYFYDNSSSSSSSYYATRTETNISITSRKYEYTYNSSTEQWMRTTYERTMNRSEISLYGRRYERVGYDSADYENYQTEVVSRSAGPSHGSSGWSAVGGSTVAVGTLNEYKYEHDLPLYNQVWDVESTKTTGSSNTTQVPNGYYLFGVTLPVPLITEEATDNVGEYVYGSSFPMITDTVLQQYIYFAENGNLSPTFINARPNGMYVLATSSGSTFGSILPANLKFDQLLPLYASEGELPSFDVNYDMPTRIIASTDPFYANLQTEYQALFQTMYSDKSRLLDDNDQTLILEEDGGSYTKLYRPSVVQPTVSVSRGIITFNLNMAMLDFTESNFATVDYHILGEMLPKNAIFAQTIEDYYGLPYGSDTSAYTSSYQALLEDFVNPDIPIEEKEDLTPNWIYTFDSNNPTTGIITIGYLTSYSEVSQYYASFLNDNYVTDYEIRLNVTFNASATAPVPYSYQIDGGTTRTPFVTNITVEPIDTSLTINFRDYYSVLPVGTDILSLGTYDNDNVVLEYYDPITESYVMVDYEDFILTSTLSQNTTYRPFSFTLQVNPQLRAGDYRVGLKLLPYQDEKTYYTFTKGTSTSRSIKEIEHYSSGLVEPMSTTFQTYVNFGYNFDFSSLTPVAVIDPEAKAYQSEVLYYTLPFLDLLKISEFAEITGVVQNATTYTAEGFRIYNFRYTIRSESGSSTTHIHQLIERPISINDVYRNNNKVVMSSSSPVVISREAVSTTVSINYGVDKNYSIDIYNLETDNPDAYFGISPSDILGITTSVTDNYLVFTIDQSALAGLYTFAITYNRTGDSPINLGNVYIQKSEGTNAYLIDIQFAELATETNYAKIYESDALGIPVPNSIYQTSIYYAGIDYDGADEDGVTNFRVDGQVSNIPLDEYIPYFLNYLPSGATIARKLSDGSYSAEVDGPEDPDIAGLAADFTSQEGVSETDDIIITYRVTSEDGLHQVYYHITVTDVTYNVSYIFDVIYEGNALKPSLIGSVIVINVRNMNTNLPVTDTIVTELPQFSEVLVYTNSTNLMYMLGFDTYKFRFGRNKSGYFSFNVSILDSDNYIYDVKIELNGTDELQTISDLDVNSSDNGKYYYINSSTKNRTRNFVITISNA
ncbi:MAG: hypothetical protein RBR75_04590, partial [Acholeplasmataceae bacterium]|nr:hypothetical protein [Acholeplasmataceae bacterium]